MGLVEARCTNCGGNIIIDESKDAGICEYCGTAFITEKAINNYKLEQVNIQNATFNVNNINLDNLIMRALEFEREEEFERALEYYDRVLDMDVANKTAKEGVSRTKLSIQNRIYLHSKQVTCMFSTGDLYLYRDRMVFVKKNGKEKIYMLEEIVEPRKNLTLLEFKYRNKTVSYGIGWKEVNTWINMIVKLNSMSKSDIC